MTAKRFATTPCTSLIVLSLVFIASSCKSKDPWDGTDMDTDASVSPGDDPEDFTDAGATTTKPNGSSKSNGSSQANTSTATRESDVTSNLSTGTTSTIDDTTTVVNGSEDASGTDGEDTDVSISNTEPDPTGTADGGTDNTPGETTSEEPEGVPGYVGVGYGGIRALSRDRGLTWEATQWTEAGGDDQELLRAVAYGNGRWVAAGWQVTTSTDGVNWTEPQSSSDVFGGNDCRIAEGAAFGNGRFMIMCEKTAVTSTDGLTWTTAGNLPAVGKHGYVVYDPETERFACTGDDRNSFVSVDGSEWTPIEFESVRLCADGLTARDQCAGFYHDGVMLKSAWGGNIDRSEDGGDFDRVYVDPLENTLYNSYSIAFGYVAAP